MPVIARKPSLWADPRNTAGIPFILCIQQTKSVIGRLVIAVTNFRAMTWSSIREIRGEMTMTSLPVNTAGYW